MLETLLTVWSVPFVSVTTAEDALSLLEQRNTRHKGTPFGLVVLDWRLPGLDGLEAAARIRARDETRALPIVLMSAYAGKEEEARCAELGVNVFLHKPITASSFFDALTEAEGAQVQVRRRAADAPLDREFVGVRVLLAEDNPANQMVASELLSRLGIELDIANNGREAVEMVRAEPARYVAILMDMQMPEMDGLAATRALRADPHFRDLPIIAMTANAMKTELDACLVAGMNDHVIKPIDRQRCCRPCDAGSRRAQAAKKWHLPPSSFSRRRHRARPRSRSRVSTSRARFSDWAWTSTHSAECSGALPTDRGQPWTRCARAWHRVMRPRPRVTPIPLPGRPETSASTRSATRPGPSSPPRAPDARTSLRCSPRWNTARAWRGDRSTHSAPPPPLFTR